MNLFRHKRVASPHDGRVHFDRVYLLRTPWFGILLHRLRRPDHDRDMHDHPWSFFSVVLWGWYEEVIGAWTRPTNNDWVMLWDESGQARNRPQIRRQIRIFNFKRADRMDPHRISYVAPGTLTLVFHGPKRRDWGFHTPQGWVPQREYRGTGRMS